MSLEFQECTDTRRMSLGFSDDLMNLHKFVVENKNSSDGHASLLRRVNGTACLISRQ